MSNLNAVNSNFSKLICIVTSFLVLCIWTTPARAFTSCVVADPSDTTLNVRDGPRGKVINRLKNGRIVLMLANRFGAKGKLWAHVGGAYRGRWREWGWVFEAHLKCSNPEALEATGSRVEKVRHEDLAANGIGWNESLAVKCPYQGEGHTISFSPGFVASYKQRGFSLKTMCIGLASEELNFDPEDGTPVPQYKIIGEAGTPGLYPFFLPRCYRSIKIMAGNNTAWTRWRPTGCSLKYHPVTGHRLQQSGDVVLSTGGEAGDGNDEVDGDTTVTDARLRALLQR